MNPFRPEEPRSRYEALGHAVQLGHQFGWEVEDIVSAAKSFSAFLEGTNEPV